MPISTGQFIFILGAIGLLAIGLLLWRLEIRNPRLMSFSPRVRRWTLPSVVLFAVALGTGSWFTPPPFGPGAFPGLIPLALVWALCLVVVFIHLKRNPALSQSS